MMQMQLQALKSSFSVLLLNSAQLLVRDCQEFTTVTRLTHDVTFGSCAFLVKIIIYFRRFAPVATYFINSVHAFCFGRTEISDIA